MPGTNALAYYSAESAAKKKRFKTRRHLAGGGSFDERVGVDVEHVVDGEGTDDAVVDARSCRRR